MIASRPLQFVTLLTGGWRLTAIIRFNSLKERTDSVVSPPVVKPLAMIVSMIETLEANIDSFANHNTDKILSFVIIAREKDFAD